MNERFAKIVEALEPTFQKLVQMTPLRVDQISGVVPERGIYLFSEGPTHLYVGRTNSLKKRIQNHGRAGNTHHKATFAFRIARLETGIKATYKSEGSRDQLEKDPNLFGPRSSQRWPAFQGNGSAFCRGARPNSAGPP